MLVELDIFSGRPNPRWEVDEPVRRELKRLESGLGAAAGPPRAPPGLGYRGFLYRLDGGRRRAFLGRIDREGAALDDPGRAIERLLLRSLPEDLAPLADEIAPLLSDGPPA